MNAHIITIGDEILTGQTLDTNSKYISTELNKIGIKILQIQSIPDHKENIIKALDTSLEETQLIILTGGLGPTNDDITKKVLSEYFKDELVLNNEVLNDIESYFNQANIELLEVNRQQALLPSKARIIRNDLGTASGMWFRKDDKNVISLPGVPYEMVGLIDKIIPLLSTQFKTADYYHRTILFQGIVESKLAIEIKEIEKECYSKGINLAYLPTTGIVKVRFTGLQNHKGYINQLIDKLKFDLAKWLYGEEPHSLESIVGKLLKDNNSTLSTVESCTSGGLAKRITSVAGSSAYFEGSIVSYSNEIKSDLVGVPEAILNKYGAVSKEVIELMAENGRKKLKTDYCISTSGIAGPDGGTKEKPVGTVWICIATKDETYSKRFNFRQNRDRNIESTIVFALNFLRRIMLKLD